MLRSMSSWIYDKDPFQPLQWTEPLEHFKVTPPPPSTLVPPFASVLWGLLLENTPRSCLEGTCAGVFHNRQQSASG